MGREHRYQATVTWTGNLGEGTAGYRSYSRDHEISGEGKPALLGSSDKSFHGDAGRWNPEELLVAALSQCHMLWFLHLCAVNGIVVTSYVDDAQGTMTEGGDGGGEFTAVILRPRAAIADSSQAGRVLELHEEAHRFCFIARSVNFPVSCEPVIPDDRHPGDRAQNIRLFTGSPSSSGSSCSASICEFPASRSRTSSARYSSTAFL